MQCPGAFLAADCERDTEPLLPSDQFLEQRCRCRACDCGDYVTEFATLALVDTRGGRFAIAPAIRGELPRLRANFILLGVERFPFRECGVAGGSFTRS
jgi:hypothetical protein